MTAQSFAQSPLLWIASWIVWKIPGRAAAKFAQFSHAEAGSGMDMLDACAQTSRRDMRRKYYQHAMDEVRHARMFYQRSTQLAPTGRSRAQAVLEDESFIVSHGVRGEISLFERFGELEFLAFVWIAEERAVKQFAVYKDLMAGDAQTTDMLRKIDKDERFHVSYSRHELERYRKKGQNAQVRMALLRVRTRRIWESWLRLGHFIGEFVSGIWLTILYFLALGPFSIIAKKRERTAGGLLPPRQDSRPLLQRAMGQG